MFADNERTGSKHRLRLRQLSHQLSPKQSHDALRAAPSASSEVEVDYPGYSPAPLSTADPREAFDYLQTHGAVVFEATPPHEAARFDAKEMRRLAASVAPTVFGQELALAKAPVTKEEDGALLRSQPHQDGGQAYGNAVNDYLVLLGDTPAENGTAGESYLLDAEAIVAALPERLQQALRDVHMEQGVETHGFPFGRRIPPCHGDCDSESAAAARAGRPTLWRSALWRPAGENGQRRSFFRCPTGGGTRVHQHLDYPVAGLPAKERHLGEEATLAFRNALLHADNAAPRFTLLRGHALIIDNYRMLHGRERFSGPRKIWRVWFWSKRYQFADAPEPAWLSSLASTTAKDVIEAAVAGVSSEAATQWGEGPGLHSDTRDRIAEIAALDGVSGNGLSEQQIDELAIHAFNVRWKRDPGVVGM